MVNNFRLEKLARNPDELLRAILTDNVQLIEKLIDYDAHLFWDDDETTLMYAARYSDNPKTFQLLLEKEEDLDAKNSHGKTPLHYAATSYSPAPETVKFLIDSGADLDVADRDMGQTPLLMALSQTQSTDNRRSQVVRVLLEAGSNPQAIDKQGQTPLMKAAARWRLDSGIVPLLLDRGANVEAKDRRGWTPLMFAIDQSAHNCVYLARTGKHCERCLDASELVELLLHNGSDIEATTINGTTPLMLAAKHHTSPEILQLLLNNGAHLESKDNDGQTALMYAAKYQKSFKHSPHQLDYAIQLNLLKTANISTAQRLVEEGANIEARDSAGKTALTIAVVESGAPEIVQPLLDMGANLEAPDDQGWTPLMHAANSSTSLKIVQLLLDQGAQKEAKSSHGSTPLMFAASNSKTPEIVQALLRDGANIEAKDNDGWTPLMRAASHSSTLEVLQLLIDHRANLEAENNDGRTALMLAARLSQHPEMVQLLIDQGADVNARCNDGKKAIDYAKGNENLKDTAAYQQLLEMSKE
jgi:serine/threonine-protein phosphatase 6 regulatory ankyrin repeat subunit A/serine/threonine-protein phosphatase 6 regulatory ankyrin repeat subunit B